MSRLTIDMSAQQHQSLKAFAALQGKTIKQYALERLFPGDTDAERISAGLAGAVSVKSVDEILDEKLAASAGARV